MSERIRSLKGKRVHIKRMVRGADGSYALKDSLLGAEATAPSSSPGTEYALPVRRAPSRARESDATSVGRRFRSSDAGQPRTGDMRLSVYYERLASGRRAAEGMGSSHSTMRRSTSLSRAFAADEEPVRLPPLAVKLEDGLASELAALETDSARAVAAINEHFEALRLAVGERIAAARDALIERSTAHRRRVGANGETFAGWLATFRGEEASDAPGRGAAIVRTVRVCERGRQVREEAINALLPAPRVRLEALKRLIAFAAENWQTFGGGNCAFADSATATDALNAETKQIINGFSESLAQIQSFYRESDVRDAAALTVRVELEPLLSPSRHSLSSNARLASRVTANALPAAAVTCVASTDRLVAWAAGPGALQRYAPARRAFERLPAPPNFAPTLLHVFGAYPHALNVADKVRGATARRDYLLFDRATPAALILFDAATNTVAREWPLPSAPTAATPLKDGCSALAVCGETLLLLSLGDAQPLQSLALPAAALGLHLSAGLTLLYVLLAERGVASVELRYAFDSRCNCVALAGAQLRSHYSTPDQLVGLCELGLRPGCLLGLSAAGELQLLDAASLAPLESLPLDGHYAHMRLIEDPTQNSTHVVLLGGGRLGVYALDQRKQLIEAMPLEYCETGAPVFVAMPALQLLFPARKEGATECEVICAALEYLA